MHLDRKTLNLVIPIEREGQTPLYVYSALLNEHVFDAYFLPLTKTWTALIENGPDWALRQGPRVAFKMLKKVSLADGIWEDKKKLEQGLEVVVEPGVEFGLVNEFKRLTSVLTLTQDGWDTLTLYDAVNRKLVDSEDLSEVLNAVCFFTVASVSLKRKEANTLNEGVFAAYGGQVTSLSCMEFLNSLPTSTTEESSGAKAAVSVTRR